MTEQKTRLALIGAGAIGRAHIEAIRGFDGCVLAGIADPAPAAAELARGLGVPSNQDVGALLEAIRPDGAIVATPNAQHLPAVLECARRGVHVLVEKPIAESIAAAREMTSAAQKGGIRLLVGHHRRHNPILEKARENVQGGGIGRVTAVVALFLLQKPDNYFDIAWHREKGAGPVLINLIHDIDDLRFICGEIFAVQAWTSNAVRGHPVEDTAAVLLRFANGALGTITASDAVPSPWSWELTSGENPMYPRQDGNCYFICGTEGSLAVPRLDAFRYGATRGWTAPLLHERIGVESAVSFARQIRHFCRVVAGDEAPRVDGADATRTLAVVEAVHEAARRGGIVEIE
ncbi:MAG: Gfo/Idh/MocA family oxidoreductase [Casimicrobiaceae bacterium]